jgi:hypothetical protein
MIVSCNNNSQLSHDISVPIYKDAYGIVQRFDKKYKIKFTSYEIRTEYPALDVIEFYKTQFHKRNLIPYNDDGLANMVWEGFNFSKGIWEKTNQVPARFICSWIDANKRIRIFLYLRYQYKFNEVDKNQWKTTLLVSCDVHPFFDHRDIEKQIGGGNFRK